MRISLRLLFLLVPLAAVIIAWAHARHEFAITQFQIQRNQGYAETVTVPEGSNPPSRLTIDAADAVYRAYLMGHAGYAELRNRHGGSEQVVGLAFRSTDAIELFDPKEFHRLTWVSFDDSFDLDYSDLSLAYLSSLPKLEEIEIWARSSDPQAALATLPRMNAIRISLWTDQIRPFEDFPQVRGVRFLDIHVPQGSDSDAILLAVKQRLPECQVVVWDNLPP